MRRAIAASTVAAVLVFGGCSADTGKNPPRSDDGAISTIVLDGRLTLDVPGSSEPREKILEVTGDETYPVSSAAVWFYTIDGFSFIATRVVYETGGAPNLSALTDMMRARTLDEAGVRAIGDTTDITVTGRAGRVFDVAFDQSGTPKEVGRAGVIRESADTYWLITGRTVLADNMGEPTMHRVFQSMSFTEAAR